MDTLFDEKEIWTDRFSLTKATAKKNLSRNLVFAVHEALRVEKGWILALCSVRRRYTSTERTNRGKEDPSWEGMDLGNEEGVYGSFRSKVAEVSYKGVQAGWFLFRPSPGTVGTDNRIVLRPRIRMASKDTSPKTTMKQLLRVNLPEGGPLPRTAVGGKVYREAWDLERLALEADHVTLVVRDDARTGHTVRKHPRYIAQAKFVSSLLRGSRRVKPER